MANDNIPDRGDSEYELLRKIARSVAGASSGAACSVSTSKVSSGSGSVAAGKASVSMLISHNFSGSINGQAITGAEAGEFSVSAPLGMRLPAIPYVVSAGNIIITSVE